MKILEKNMEIHNENNKITYTFSACIIPLGILPKEIFLKKKGKEKEII